MHQCSKLKFRYSAFCACKCLCNNNLHLSLPCASRPFHIGSCIEVALNFTQNFTFIFKPDHNLGCLSQVPYAIAWFSTPLRGSFTCCGGPCREAPASLSAPYPLQPKATICTHVLLSLALTKFDELHKAMHLASCLLYLNN